MGNGSPTEISKETNLKVPFENTITDNPPNSAIEAPEQLNIAISEAKVESPNQAENKTTNGTKPTHQTEAKRESEKDESAVAIVDSKEPTSTNGVVLKAPEPLAVGTVVLAKVKGYSAWPGIILSDDMIPDDVLYLKPKSIKQRSKLNDKILPDATIYGVRFFVEISHVWSSRENITVLTKEMVNNYVNKQKNKRETKLLKAYKIALNPPSLSSIAQEIAERRQQDEKEEQDVSEEPVRTRSRGKKETKAVSTQKAESTTNASTNKRKSRTSKAAAMPEPKESSSPLKRAKTEEAQEPVVVVDTDPSSESSAVVAVHSPATSLAKDVKEHLETRTKLVRSIRHRLQRGFIGRTPLSEELPDLSNYLGRLEGLPELELSVMRETKIKKLLSAILRTNDIPEENKYKFKSRITTILTGWNKLSVEQTDSASATESLTPVPDSVASNTNTDNANSIILSTKPESVPASATAGAS
ncbi:hypothetical protein D0Z03_001335 [Geotrichum reessii]|nr:hypothetical protein D0Z03_001335 [Galactomyces reessii]